jgi:RNA-directed DNA polymerase
LLGNIMLDDLDCEERRGHRFVRYADDVMVYVSSERAGQRVMASITEYVEQCLKLRVNREKSRVDRATRRTFLGFGFMVRDGKVKGARRTVKRVLADEARLRDEDPQHRPLADAALRQAQPHERCRRHPRVSRSGT